MHPLNLERLFEIFCLLIMWGKWLYKSSCHHFHFCSTYLILQVRCNPIMVVCILSLWTWSLMQFTLGLTATKARKPRVAGTSLRKKKDENKPKVTEYTRNIDLHYIQNGGGGSNLHYSEH